MNCDSCELKFRNRNARNMDISNGIHFKLRIFQCFMWLKVDLLEMLWEKLILNCQRIAEGRKCSYLLENKMFFSLCINQFLKT